MTEFPPFSSPEYISMSLNETSTVQESCYMASTMTSFRWKIGYCLVYFKSTANTFKTITFMQSLLKIIYLVNTIFHHIQTFTSYEQLKVNTSSNKSKAKYLKAKKKKNDASDNFSVNGPGLWFVTAAR